jgi:RNA polymerase sigma-70 factor (ECF subfamily)
MDDENQLIEEAREGSMEAFSRLLRLHQAPLRAYLAGFIRDAEAVDDVAQEAFLGAYRNLEAYKGDAAFRTWLFGVARNKALLHLRDEARRRSRRSESLKLAVSAWLVDEAEGDASKVERELRLLDGCVGKLPKTSAALVAAYYQERQSADQIAQETGKTEVSVWKTLSRIRQALRECVELGLSTGAGGA